MLHSTGECVGQPCTATCPIEARRLILLLSRRWMRLATRLSPQCHWHIIHCTAAPVQRRSSRTLLVTFTLAVSPVELAFMPDSVCWRAGRLIQSIYNIYIFGWTNLAAISNNYHFFNRQSLLPGLVALDCMCWLFRNSAIMVWPAPSGLPPPALIMRNDLLSGREHRTSKNECH